MINRTYVSRLVLATLGCETAGKVAITMQKEVDTRWRIRDIQRIVSEVPVMGHRKL
jgi:hypothetical protein